LREALDLDAVRRQLVDVVDDAFGPTRVSVRPRKRRPG
jgi:hypothetical protein